MPAKVDLYNNAYGKYDAEVYRQISVETYGEDLGQTSWVTREESAEIPRTLRLAPGCYVLEVGCGSGRYALQVAEAQGCRVLGVDINAHGIQTANRLAVERDRSAKVRFEVCDVSKALPFGDEQFDAVFSNDVLCHIPGRDSLLREVLRVLRPGGRLLFSDALVIGGLISHEEIESRSSIGYYIFSPPGENERIIEQAGFQLLSVRDTSENAALIAKRRFEARRMRREALIAIEGEANFEGVQRFLATVYKLTSERRLLRFVYFAEKPSES
jgi:SAM-dependent methyltransferase